MSLGAIGGTLGAIGGTLPQGDGGAPTGITVALATSGGDDTNRTGSSTAYQTAPVALTAGKLYLLYVVARRSDGGNNGSLSASQTGATWTSILSTGALNYRSQIFRCQPASNVSAAVINVGNFDPAAMDFTMWALVEVSGAVNDSANNGAGAIGETGLNTATGDSPTVDVGTVAADDATIGFVFHVNTTGLTPITGTEVDEIDLNGRKLATMKNMGGDTISTQASGAGLYHILCAEVLAAA